MEIKNVQHAVQVLQEWKNLSETAQKIRIKQALEKLELNCMYYEQKGNDNGVSRMEECITLLKNHLISL